MGNQSSAEAGLERSTDVEDNLWPQARAAEHAGQRGPVPSSYSYGAQPANPFDAPGIDNFPSLDGALRYDPADAPDLGPGIETLANLYPLSFPEAELCAGAPASYTTAEQAAVDAYFSRLAESPACPVPNRLPDLPGAEPTDIQLWEGEGGRNEVHPVRAPPPPPPISEPSTASLSTTFLPAGDPDGSGSSPSHGGRSLRRRGLGMSADGPGVASSAAHLPRSDTLRTSNPVSSTLSSGVAELRPPSFNTTSLSSPRRPVVRAPPAVAVAMRSGSFSVSEPSSEDLLGSDAGQRRVHGQEQAQRTLPGGAAKDRGGSDDAAVPRPVALVGAGGSLGAVVSSWQWEAAAVGAPARGSVVGAGQIDAGGFQPTATVAAHAESSMAAWLHEPAEDLEPAGQPLWRRAAEMTEAARQQQVWRRAPEAAEPAEQRIWRGAAEALEAELLQSGTEVQVAPARSLAGPVPHRSSAAAPGWAAAHEARGLGATSGSWEAEDHGGSAGFDTMGGSGPQVGGVDSRSASSFQGLAEPGGTAWGTAGGVEGQPDGGENAAASRRFGLHDNAPVGLGSLEGTSGGTGGFEAQHGSSPCRPGFLDTSVTGFGSRQGTGGGSGDGSGSRGDAAPHGPHLQSGAGGGLGSTCGAGGGSGFGSEDGGSDGFASRDGSGVNSEPPSVDILTSSGLEHHLQRGSYRMGRVDPDASDTADVTRSVYARDSLGRISGGAAAPATVLGPPALPLGVVASQAGLETSASSSLQRPPSSAAPIPRALGTSVSWPRSSLQGIPDQNRPSDVPKRPSEAGIAAPASLGLGGHSQPAGRVSGSTPASALLQAGSHRPAGSGPAPAAPAAAAARQGTGQTGVSWEAPLPPPQDQERQKQAHTGPWQYVSQPLHNTEPPRLMKRLNLPLLDVGDGAGFDPAEARAAGAAVTTAASGHQGQPSRDTIVAAWNSSARFVAEGAPGGTEAGGAAVPSRGAREEVVLPTPFALVPGHAAPSSDDTLVADVLMAAARQLHELAAARRPVEDVAVALEALASASAAGGSISLRPTLTSAQEPSARVGWATTEPVGREADMPATLTRRDVDVLLNDFLRAASDGGATGSGPASARAGVAPGGGLAAMVLGPAALRAGPQAVLHGQPPTSSLCMPPLPGPYSLMDLEAELPHLLHTAAPPSNSFLRAVPDHLTTRPHQQRQQAAYPEPQQQRWVQTSGGISSPSFDSVGLTTRMTTGSAISGSLAPGQDRDAGSGSLAASPSTAAEGSPNPAGLLDSMTSSGLGAPLPSPPPPLNLPLPGAAGASGPRIWPPLGPHGGMRGGAAWQADLPSSGPAGAAGSLCGAPPLGAGIGGAWQLRTGHLQAECSADLYSDGDGKGVPFARLDKQYASYQRRLQREREGLPFDSGDEEAEAVAPRGSGGQRDFLSGFSGPPARGSNAYGGCGHARESGVRQRRDETEGQGASPPRQRQRRDSQEATARMAAAQPQLHVSVSLDTGSVRDMLQQCLQAAVPAVCAAAAAAAVLGTAGSFGAAQQRAAAEIPERSFGRGPQLPPAAGRPGVDLGTARALFPPEDHKADPHGVASNIGDGTFHLESHCNATTQTPSAPHDQVVQTEGVALPQPLSKQAGGADWRQNDATSLSCQGSSTSLSPGGSERIRVGALGTPAPLRTTDGRAGSGAHGAAAAAQGCLPEQAPAGTHTRWSSPEKAAHAAVPTNAQAPYGTVLPPPTSNENNIVTFAVPVFRSRAAADLFEQCRRDIHTRVAVGPPAAQQGPARGGGDGGGSRYGASSAMGISAPVAPALLAAPAAANFLGELDLNRGWRSYGPVHRETAVPSTITFHAATCGNKRTRLFSPPHQWMGGVDGLVGAAAGAAGADPETAAGGTAAPAAAPVAVAASFSGSGRAGLKAAAARIGAAGAVTWNPVLSRFAPPSVAKESDLLPTTPFDLAPDVQAQPPLPPAPTSLEAVQGLAMAPQLRGLPRDLSRDLPTAGGLGVDGSLLQAPSVSAYGGGPALAPWELFRSTGNVSSSLEATLQAMADTAGRGGDEPSTMHDDGGLRGPSDSVVDGRGLSTTDWRGGACARQGVASGGDEATEQVSSPPRPLGQHSEMLTRFLHGLEQRAL